MIYKTARDRSCSNPACELYDQVNQGNIIRHSFIKLTRGKRARYRCKACGKTFCSTTATPYHRLHHSRKTFDEVVMMSVEGVSKSSIARVKGISWNTVARWVERAAGAARRFNDHMTVGYKLKELQADEIRTFIAARLYLSLNNIGVWDDYSILQSTDLSEYALKWYERILIGEKKCGLMYGIANNARKIFGKKRVSTTFYEKRDRIIVNKLFEKNITHVNESGKSEQIDCHEFFDTHFLDGNNSCTPRYVLLFLKKLIEEECRIRGISPSELKGGSKRQKVSEARAEIAKRSREELGLGAAEIARHLGVNTSSITRAIERAL